MMTEIFTGLTNAVSGTPLIAILASVAWGVLSIVLSPCHLASIPLIIGFIGEQGAASAKRAFLLALLFSTGILATIAIIGVATAAFGRMLGDLGPHMNYIVAVILAAFILGLVFGLALGPCTFAFMAPMLGITLSVARTNMGYGILLLGAYGIGHCGVIVAAGTSTGAVERYLKWSGASRGLGVVKKVCGLLVIIGGIYLLWAS